MTITNIYTVSIYHDTGYSLDCSTYAFTNIEDAKTFAVSTVCETINEVEDSDLNISMPGEDIENAAAELGYDLEMWEFRNEIWMHKDTELLRIDVTSHTIEI